VIVCACAPISPRPDHLPDDVADDVAWRSEPDALAAAALREDHRVDPDEASIGIHQRAAAVAGIDRRVGLHVDHRVLRLELPRHRAHNPHRDGRRQAERTAEREHQLAGAEGVGVAVRQRGQGTRGDLQDREVGLIIDRDDLRADDAAAAAEDRPARIPSRRGERQFHLDARGVLHDMRVGDHVAIRVNDDTRSTRTPRRRNPRRRRSARGFQRIRGHENLDDARTHLLGELLQRPGQFGQARRPRALRQRGRRA
jgi:hypothetical protein